MEQAHDSRRRPRILYGRGEFIVYAVFVLLALTLILLPDSQQRELASHVEDFALYPFRHTVLSVERMFTLWESNRQLAEELAALRVDALRVDEVRRENRRLREMLDLSPRPGIDVIGCEILSAGGGRCGEQTLLLDRGYAHGIRADTPITGREGLAGKVVEVYPQSARAILLGHRQCAVSVRDTRSRISGIVEWSAGPPDQLKLRGIAYLADIAVGDTLVTSGLGQVYPAGLPVGTVAAMTRDVNRLVLDVTVEPAVDLQRLEQVFALKRTDGPTGGEAADGEAPAAEVVELR